MRQCVLAGLCVIVACAAPVMAADVPDIVGRWDLTVGEPPHTYPSWIGVSKDGDGYRVQFLWAGGGVENPPANARVEGNTVTFQARDMNWEATAKGDFMTGTATEKNGRQNRFIGKRFVPVVKPAGTWKLKGGALDGAVLRLSGTAERVTGSIEGPGWSDLSDVKLTGNELTFRAVHDGKKVSARGLIKGDVLEGTIEGGEAFTGARERQWGEPIQLFNGKDLTGWKFLGDEQKSKWTIVDGVLTNTGRGSHLMTERKFEDFKLHVEFRVPKRSNSGIYLRGRYEIQVEDSYGKKPGGGICGAIYSRITPRVNASKPPGEWQTFDATLIGNYITLVHNGELIIDNQEIEGITGGAIDSFEHEPGPIYIQGDHGPVEYRSIVITPAK